MKQTVFTAQELYCMAFLRKKQKMYGIPDAMDTDRKKRIQETLDNMFSEQLTEMDLDGHIFLNRAYHDLVDYFCDCQKCLTVNLQREGQTTQNLIFWQHNNQYMMAEAIDNRYAFSCTDKTMVRALLDNMLYHGKSEAYKSEAVIPQNQLAKAKKLCIDGKMDDVIRLLRQNGATEELACVIANVLQEKAYFLGLLCMDIQQDQCLKREKNFLAGNDILLLLGETVINLRSCATFLPINLSEMRAEVSGLINTFLGGGEGVAI